MKKRKFQSVFSTIILLVPVYLFSQNHEKLIKDYRSVHNFREYKKADLTSFTVTATDPSQSLKGSVVKFEQSYQGLPIYSSAGVALIRNNDIIYCTDNFIKDYNVSFSTVAINKEKALQKSVKKRNIYHKCKGTRICGFFKGNNQKIAIINQHIPKLKICYN